MFLGEKEIKEDSNHSKDKDGIAEHIQKSDESRTILKGIQGGLIDEREDIAANLNNQIAAAKTKDGESGKNPDHRRHSPPAHVAVSIDQPCKENNTEEKRYDEKQILKSQKERFEQIRQQHIPNLKHHPVASGHTDKQMLGKFIKGIVLVQKTKNSKSQKDL